jgi:hypothetical protein
MNSNDMINQIKTLLGMETKLAQAKLENGTIIEADEMAEGNEIFIVTQENERIAMPVGEYQLEDGQVLIVEEEGIIASVGAAEEAPEEEVSEEVEASEEVIEEALEEEDKEEMGYATKEELAEVKSMIEEIKAMIEKEEMSKDVSEEVKEELSAIEKVTHNPEIEDKKISFLYGQSRPQNTMDRVMAKISQIKK